jgi:hypothetical protein
MSYLWAVFVITALESGDYKYTHISTHETRMSCEIQAALFVAINEPFIDSETVKCVKVDEA